MSWIFLQPQDVWLFRDSRSFSAGEGHHARLIFPPPPSTVQGALRNIKLEEYGVSREEYLYQTTPQAEEVAQVIGYPPNQADPGDLGLFSMAGPFLARREGDKYYRYVPLPVDLTLTKDKDNELVYLSPSSKPLFTSNWKGTTELPFPELLPLWTYGKIDHKAKRDLWIREDAFLRYLSEQPLDLERDCQRSDDLFVEERRFGNSIEYTGEFPTGRTREKYLYQASFIRTCPDTGLLVYVDDRFDMPPVQNMPMGGERRNTLVEVIQSPDQVEARQGWNNEAYHRLKVVFLTPAYFENGWMPQDNDWSSFIEGSPQLVSVAVSTPLLLGGWDVANNRPRALVPFVRPGSVFFFKSDEPIALKSDIMTESPPDLADAAAMGFGQVATGTWNYLEE